MGHLQGFENVMGQIRCIRLSRKLFDDEGEQVVLRVPVFPGGTRPEAQGAIAKRLNLFIGCVGRAFTLEEVFPVIFRKTGRVR